MLCLGIGSVCRFSYRVQRVTAVRSDRRLLLIAVRDGAEVKQRDEEMRLNGTRDVAVVAVFLSCHRCRRQPAGRDAGAFREVLAGRHRSLTVCHRRCRVSRTRVRTSQGHHLSAKPT